MTFTFPAIHSDVSAVPIDCRKRKEVEEDHDCEESLSRSSGLKGLRRWPNGGGDDGSQEAQFHPLPRELNLQLLANLGYFTNQSQTYDTARQGGTLNHSPSSSGSDFGPSTPSDVLPASAESYFAKGMKSEAGSSPSYPNFNIYPEHVYPRPPGLLGMHMQASKSRLVDPNGDGMDVDDDDQGEAGPSHGPHCKSIPQLHCRGNGATKELWARCQDCGTMSQVDCPRVSDPLAYSP